MGNSRDCGGDPIRSTAYRVSVIELLKGEFKPSAGEYDPSYVRVGLKEVNRCDVIGTLVSENPMTLDDGSGEIKVLSFDGLSAKEGELVRIIGKIREREGERFISAEIIRPVNEQWQELRKLELEPKTEIREIEM